MQSPWDTDDEHAAPGLPPAPFRPRFSLRSLMLLTTACGVIAATFRWLGITWGTSLLIGILFVGSILAALSLVVVIVNRERDD